MTTIEFKIVGKPMVKKAPFFFRCGKGIRSFTPERTKRWEKIVRGQAVRHRPPELLEGPLDMEAVFWLPRPKSLPKKVIHHSKKPDLDNLIKALKDALQGIIYKNDSQVKKTISEKKYVLDGAVPGVFVLIKEVEEGR